jgi:hypothetical protein
MEAETSSDQRPVIQASDILDKIKRGEDVEYDGVIVEGDLLIYGVNLPTEHVDRTEDEKRSGLSEERKIVSSQITIKNSVFRDGINFTNVHFKNTIFIWSVVVRGFWGVGAKFTGGTSFWNVKVVFDAVFTRSEFNHDNATFWGAEFGGDAIFQGTEFIGEGSSFWSAKFSRNAYFKGAKFSGRAIFLGAKFDGSDVNFKDTKFSDPKSQEMACRIAKRKMEGVGNKKEADDYFYREMEAIRIQKGIRGTEKLKLPWKMQVSEWLKLVGSKFWRLVYYDIFEYIFIQGIFGYGVSPLRVLSYWIIIAFAFASIYWYCDAVDGASEWFDYIWFSIATSATPGYALYNPIGHYKIVTGVQAIIGTFMWAAFIATFARKWQR